ncbi:UNVERIFIED_CONTAM: hypothetical protein FKN15_023265 [Acipenser sinensis]
MKLAKIPIIADVYYIVAGARPNQGVVVTRNREGPADIWPLDPVNGRWYQVETNYDHWTTPPPFDDRRITIYTTVMSAAFPEMYRTEVRKKT